MIIVIIMHSNPINHIVNRQATLPLRTWSVRIHFFITNSALNLSPLLESREKKTVAALRISRQTHEILDAVRKHKGSFNPLNHA